MQGLVQPRHRDLDPRHEAQADVGRLGRRLGEAEQLVVVGEGQQINPVGLGASHHRGGRESAVGGGRVAMQVGVEGVHDPFDNKNGSMIRATTSGWS